MLSEFYFTKCKLYTHIRIRSLSATAQRAHRKITLGIAIPLAYHSTTNQPKHGEASDERKFSSQNRRGRGARQRD